MKNNGLLALFIRAVVYAGVLLGVLEILKYDSTVGEIGTRFGENSGTEIAQEAFLILASIVCYFAAWRNKRYRPLLISIGTFTLVSFVREFNNYMKYNWFDGAWQIIVYTILAPYLFYAFKQWRAIKQNMEELSSTFSFGILLCAVLIVFLFSRIYGLHGIWENLLGEHYIRDVKNISEEGIELLGYSFLFLGAVEVALLNLFDKKNTH